MRTLDLEIVYVKVIDNPTDFVEHFALEEEFEKEFKCKIGDWEFDVSDDNVYEQMSKFIDTPDRIYFWIWNDDIENFEFYYIRQKVRI